MGKHLRKLFSADNVKEVFQRYLSREIAVEIDEAIAALDTFQWSSNFTGSKTQTAIGCLPIRAGSKSHFLTASAAAMSRSGCPADCSIWTSPTLPFSRTRSLRSVIPWAP